MKKILLPILMVFAIAALLVGTVPANAAFKLSLDDLSDAAPAIIITDGDGNDNSGLVGRINVDLQVGVFHLVASIGLSKPLIGPAAIDITGNVLTTATPPGPVTIELMLTDTDFTLPDGTYGFTNRIGGTTTETAGVTAEGFLDPGNAEFAMTSGTGLMGPFGPGDFSGSATGIASIMGPFSLTEKVLVTHNAEQDLTTFDKELRVPEPGTMLLIGTGLLGLAGIGRRRLRKK